MLCYAYKKRCNSPNLTTFSAFGIEEHDSSHGHKKHAIAGKTKSNHKKLESKKHGLRKINHSHQGEKLNLRSKQQVKKHGKNKEHQHALRKTKQDHQGKKLHLKGRQQGKNKEEHQIKEKKKHGLKKRHGQGIKKQVGHHTKNNKKGLRPMKKMNKSKKKNSGRGHTRKIKPMKKNHI